MCHFIKKNSVYTTMYVATKVPAVHNITIANLTECTTRYVAIKVQDVHNITIANPTESTTSKQYTPEMYLRNFYIRIIESKIQVSAG